MVPGIQGSVRRITGALAGAAARAGRLEREAAFTAFVEAVSPALLRAALVLLDSREEAEDALQLTLLRTFRRWERAKEAPEAYSRAVLVNVCRERWRHRFRHPESVRAVADLGDVDVADVVSFAEAVDRRHVLVRALRQLPDVQREVLVFRYLLDATVAETAVSLGIAEGTVKSAASRGLEQLRMLLSAEEKKVRRVYPR